MVDALSLLTPKERAAVESEHTVPALRVSLLLLAELRALRADLAETRGQERPGAGLSVALGAVLGEEWQVTRELTAAELTGSDPQPEITLRVEHLPTSFKRLITGLPKAWNADDLEFLAVRARAEFAAASPGIVEAAPARRGPNHSRKGGAR